MEGTLFSIGSACWLGVLTSISPCPLATNIAALSFISKDLGSPRRVLLTGVLYTLGRSFAYATLGGLLVATIFAIPDVSFWLETYMNKALGPILVLIGVVLLDLIPFRFSTSCVTDGIQARFQKWGLWGASLLGILFALSFCPVSAALYFGSLLPLAVKNGSAIVLPAVYGIGTALPVLVFAVLLALGAQWVARVFNKLIQGEKWARRVTAAVFLLIGIHFCLNYIFEVQL